MTGGGMQKRWWLALAVVVALPALAAEPAKVLTPSEKLAAAILEGRSCKQLGPHVTVCTYRYGGLRLIRVEGEPADNPPKPTAGIKVYEMGPGIEVTLMRGYGRCLLIQEGVASVMFSVDTGTLYSTEHAGKDTVAACSSR